MTTQSNINYPKISIYKQSWGRLTIPDFASNNTIKMIQRFLIEKKMRICDLADAIGITTKDLGLFMHNEKPPKTIAKINLSLIKLYCKTKWV
ncbi:MAG: hypothetical protein M1561_07740 [Gammaproteobacteria bacterium]|nr:hypothetical protein [Gammaproteobacteria bacterium]